MSEDTGPAHGAGETFSDLVGLEFTAREEGYSRCEVTVTGRLKNPHDVVHGAVPYAMADTGMGAALTPGLAEGELCATIEVKISYMKPVFSGELTCETTVLQRGGSVAYLESEIRNEDDEVVARATGSYSIFEP